MSTIDKTLRVQAKSENLALVEEMVQELAGQLEYSQKQRRYLSVACDELFSNIVKYAYPAQEGEITVSASGNRQTGKLSLRFSDAGAPFNPLEAPEADLTLPPDERPVGKMGIRIVRRLAESVSYNRENGCNVLTVVFGTKNDRQTQTQEKER